MSTRYTEIRTVVDGSAIVMSEYRAEGQHTVTEPASGREVTFRHGDLLPKWAWPEDGRRRFRRPPK